MTDRRDFIKSAAAVAGTAITGFPAIVHGMGQKNVVVIGGGYGGATAARYVMRWGGPKFRVTLIERNTQFISCPLSNLVLGGSKTLADITRSYDGLRKELIMTVQDEAAAIDPAAHLVKLKSGRNIDYERLIVSPGVDFLWDQVGGMSSPEAQAKILHAWKAGPQTVALRKQLEAMDDGGVFGISIPLAPYRCPPGPYERACQVAHYFKQYKPKSKVLVLDANDKIVSKPALFEKAFKERYANIIEYRPNSKLVEMDIATNTAKFEFDDVKADVWNVIPPQRAADIAKQAGLITANNKWCEVNWLSMVSKADPDIHVLGDATLSGPMMPKSGHMANQHGKLAAAAIVNLMNGKEPNPEPVVMNTCYSFLDDKSVIHVASVHQYNKEKKVVEPVQGAGGVSKEASELEGEYAFSWAKNIWADMLGG
ncbi:MAG: twin-arginine translocation signal domain-containing protein [Betaproteobacteria bacterium]|nr:twin-arginine translocation signal domain-containing protein [Betaproteobacteria bacterium]